VLLIKASTTKEKCDVNLSSSPCPKWDFWMIRTEQNFFQISMTDPWVFWYDLFDPLR
jgi:hypothetical protein